MDDIEKSDWDRDSLTDWPTIFRIASATENHKFKDELKFFLFCFFSQFEYLPKSEASST